MHERRTAFATEREQRRFIAGNWDYKGAHLTERLTNPSRTQTHFPPKRIPAFGEVRQQQTKKLRRS